MDFMYVNLFIFYFILETSSLNNGLCRTPPMGFNTWERFRCTIDCENFPESCISERLIKRTADKLASELKCVGYTYLVIDDCWSADTRNKKGELEPNATRFPSGMLDLSRYIHSLGLKFGIYGNYGTLTCAGYPGIKTDLKSDVNLFVSWEVDFVKLDGCYSDIAEKATGYPEFGKLLKTSGRNIVYSCSWPAYQNDIAMMPNYTALEESCNLWRNYDDVEDSWNSVLDILDYFALNQDILGEHHKPGAFNDPDMLIIGNYGLSLDQSRAQMALWCILGAPLFISTDLDTLRPEFKQILTNKKAIAIDQDPLCAMGRRVYRNKNIEIWRKRIMPCYLSYDSYAIAFLNRRTDGKPYRIVRTLEQLALYNPKGYEIEDIFTGIKKNTSNRDIAVFINPSGVVFLKATIIP